jgi:oligopeptidase B
MRKHLLYIGDRGAHPSVRWLRRAATLHCIRRVSACALLGGLIAASLPALAAAPALAEASALPDAPAPPVAARRPHPVESPNGTRIDDYYWLRDDTRESQDVLEYLARENEYRDAVMRPVAALEQKLYEELVAHLQPDDASVPVREHGYWYYTRYEPGLDYPVYARRKGAMSAAEQVMLDGNAMARGHAFFQVGATAVSPDGKLLAFTEDYVGRRQYTLRIKNLRTGALLDDRVANIEPEIVWAADSRTVLYVEKDPVTLLSVRLRKHRLGADPARDPLVYEEPDHSYYMGVRKSRSEHYLFIELQSTNQTEWRYADARDPRLDFKVVLPREPDHEYQVEHLGKDFLIRTNWQAPNFRIVRAPVARRADKRSWRDVVPARTDAFVQDFEVSDRFLAVGERQGGLLRIRIKSWDGRQDRLIGSAEPASTMTLVPTPGIHGATVRYIYTSLTTPRTTYDYDMRSGRKQLRKADTVPGGFSSADYATEYLHATARDGRQVPVTVAYRKGTRLDGTAPLYQYGYGSYGISIDPEFERDWISLLDRGFVVAIAHVRGGQELGREWFEDGRLLHKRNTFTDFIDVTDYLVQRGYGARDKIFAQGDSAGGLLMGAVANIAPQKYRGIVTHVPFVDAVTTMLDETIPLTSNEFDQWGNPKEKVSYDYMLSYSPYDNVSAQDYPAMLVFTSLWDSQVQYYEPAKWVAKLRATKTDRNPLVFSINMVGGHGGRSGRLQRCHDTALAYAFMLDALGIGR